MSSVPTTHTVVRPENAEKMLSWFQSELSGSLDDNKTLHSEGRIGYYDRMGVAGPCTDFDNALRFIVRFLESGEEQCEFSDYHFQVWEKNKSRAG